MVEKIKNRIDLLKEKVKHIDKEEKQKELSSDKYELRFSYADEIKFLRNILKQLEE